MSSILAEPSRTIEDAKTAKAAKLIHLRTILSEKFPAAPVKTSGLFPTGWQALDQQEGGLRRGVLTELTGSFGGGALFIDTLLQATWRTQGFMALIDGARCFDPQGIPGRILSRLLWVLCEGAEPAVKAADLLLRDGNLPLVVLDLQSIPAKELRRVPASTWHRFHRLVEQTSTVFLVLTPQPMVEGAKVRLVMRNRWTLAAMKMRRTALMSQADLQVFVRSSVPQFSGLQVQTA